MSIATSATASCGAGGTLSRDTVGICRVTHMSLAARGPLRLQLVSAAFSIAVSCLVRSTYGPKELQTPVYVCIWWDFDYHEPFGYSTGYLAVASRAVAQHHLR
eukprot:Em0014g573a